MDAFEFSKQVIQQCSKYTFIKGIEILLIDEPVAKIKAIIDNHIFINIFYNASTQRFSFTLIKNNIREYLA